MLFISFTVAVLVGYMAQKGKIKDRVDSLQTVAADCTAGTVRSKIRVSRLARL